MCRGLAITQIDRIRVIVATLGLFIHCRLQTIQGVLGIRAGGKRARTVLRVPGVQKYGGFHLRDIHGQRSCMFIGTISVKTGVKVPTSEDLGQYEGIGRAPRLHFRPSRVERSEKSFQRFHFSLVLPANC